MGRHEDQRRALEWADVCPQRIRTMTEPLVCGRQRASQFPLRPYSAPQFPLHPYNPRIFGADVPPGAGPDLPSDVTEGLLGLPADAVGPVPLEALVFAQKALAHRLECFPLGGP